MYKPLWTALSAYAFLLGTGTVASALDFTSQPTNMTYSDGSYQGATTVRTDSQNNVYYAVISETGNGKIVKHNPSGQLQWAVEFDPGNSRPADKSPYVVSNGLSAIAVDAADNIYAVGESGNGTNLDCLLKKYNAGGELVWEQRYNRAPSGTLTFNQYCNDLTIDPAGNIIAAGTTQPIENGNIANWSNRIIKWNSNGTLLGTFGIETGNEACGPSYPCMMQIKRIASDANGNLVTIERSQGFRADRLVKYSPALEMTTATPMLLASTTVSPTGVTSDERCGYLYNDLVQFDEQLAEICSGPEWYPVLLPTEMPGEYQSVVATTADYPNIFGLRVDAAGNIYTVGYAGDYNKLIVFDSNLTKTCEDTRRYYDPAQPSFNHDVYDIYRDVVIGPNGNAYAVGSESKAFLVMEYDSQCRPVMRDIDGNPAPLLYQVPTAERHYATSITFDSSNNLIVAGQSLRRDANNWWVFLSDATALKFSRNIPVELVADLAVNAVAGPATGSSLDQVMVSGTVANLGTGSTGGNFVVGVYLSTDAAITETDTFLCSATMGALEAGIMQDFSCTSALPGNIADGTYFIGVIADSGNIVVEPDETNNTASAPVIFTALPDVVLQSATSPVTSVADTAMTISGTVKNDGLGNAAGTITVSAALSNGTAICSKTIDGLLAGQSVDFSCTGTTPHVTPGTYSIIVTATLAAGMSEITTSNNSFTTPIQVTGKPDLVVTSLYGPLTVKKGQKVTYTGIIKNQGVLPASYFLLSGYTSPDGAISTSDAFVCNTGVASIAPGEFASFSCAGSIPSANRGSVYLGVIVDATNAVAESNETNNTAKMVITVN